MAKIHNRREHRLDHAAARAEVQKLADKLAGELSASYKWSGDRLEFWRSGADGHVDVGDGVIEFEIKLGMLLTPLKGKIESTISDYLDQHLG